jgi:uncharacterized membrane protein YcjF (UPF0283 family)
MSWKKLLLLNLMIFFSIAVFAQGTKSGFDNLMRSNGRIYVVVAVVVTILLGLVLYLVRLDKKISRLEKENQ